MRHAFSFPLLAVLAVSLTSGTQDRKPTLKPAEYSQWESLGASGISADGRWFYASTSRPEADPRLLVRSCDGPERWEMESASGAVFSDNSKWVGCSMVVPRTVREQMTAQKRRPENKLSLRNLSNGSETVYDSVTRWAFAKGSQHLVLEHYRAQGKTAGGSEIEIIDLADASSTPIANVSNWQWHKDGRYLLVQLEGEGGQRGLQLVDVSNMGLRTIRWGKTNIANLTFSKDGKTLAFFEGTPNDKKDGDWQNLVIVTGFDSPKLNVRTIDPKSLAEFPEGSRVAEFGGLRLSDDGQKVAFGIKPWSNKTAAPTRPQDRPGVEIWHSRDPIVVPLQRNMAAAERNRTDKCVLNLSDSTFRVFAPAKFDVTLLANMDSAIVRDVQKYASAVKENGLEYVDVELLDVWSGKRTTIMEKAISNAGGRGAATVSSSREGKFVCFYRGGDWFIADTVSHKVSNMTAGIKDEFSDPLDDSTVPEVPAAGFPTWLANDAGCVISTFYDEYLIEPKSLRATKLTNGRADKISYSLMNMGFSEEGIRLSDPMYFLMIDQDTKASGFGRREKDGSIKPLIFLDKLVQFVAKSKDTDRVVIRMQTFEESPNAFVTNLEFSQAKPMTKTNPQQEKYAWGKAELISYKNKRGVPLQGILMYPADYRPGRSYPMITYIYERLSDGLHQYRNPNPLNYYDLQHYSQAGYFVLCPDIAYDDRGPGLSAVDCIETAVKTAVGKGVGIDATKVGLTGHSWGGYQTVFLATQSKVFSAYVAGAPLTEMIAMSNSFYWNWGQSNQVIFESSQGRLPKPFYDDLGRYMANSPLFHAKNVMAPMLVEVGTVDGAVDWTQGQFLYNTLRRLGKEMILLVYANENHSLANPANMKDYAKRAQHFFDVYLKGARAEKWVKEGLPVINLDEELNPKPDKN